MRIAFVLNLVLSAAVAQQPSLSCVYSTVGVRYRCLLTINNPDGFNNFTEIAGTHLDGFGNSDVYYVSRLSGVSPNIPSAICETFPNAQEIDFYNLALTEIDDGALSSCSRISTLNLFRNKIAQISENAFANLTEMQTLYLRENLLTTLSDNVFANQQNLTRLDMGWNPISNIPPVLFQPLENLEWLSLDVLELTTLNYQWFESNKRLTYLSVEGNQISEFIEATVSLESLRQLSLSYNEIREILSEALSQMPNLEYLFLYGNNITEVQANAFHQVKSLLTLNLDENPLELFHEGAFNGLGNLTILSAENCALGQLHSNSFEGLQNLVYLFLSSNNIENLPEGIFPPSLVNILLRNNRLKTLRRNAFGNSLTNLRTMDLENNVLNALDKAIIDEAVNLNTLYLRGNLCADTHFGEFVIGRDQFLPMLETCFSNMRYVIDTITEGNAEFSFFEGPPRGTVLRVNASSEIQIALTAFAFVWNPIVEILIGTNNNTRSEIRINQQTNVVTVPTPNILQQGQWNDFRVVWANQVIHVYRGSDSFPFMSYTMQWFFPVNFYGVRAVEMTVLWSLQPF